MSDMVERVARALCESHIRNVRRHDTDPKRLEAMIVRAIELNWKGHVEEAQAAIAAMQADAAPVATYRHKKRGTLYTVLGEGTLQCSANELLDNQPIVVYRGEDGKLWARGVAEFHDGRFEAVADRVSTSSPVVAHETPETSDKLAALQTAAEKLAGYAGHDDDCQIMNHGVWTDSIPCTCGYTDAWWAYEAAKQASK